MSYPLVSDFEKIIIENTPLIDLRAPIEFAEGSFENAINLPLMTTEERHLVGTCYKEKGQKDAIALGLTLVSGDIKEKRVAKWIEFINRNPSTILFCFRGGLRSKITQEWIYEATGKWIPRIEGGYKAFRNYMISKLESSNQTLPLYILGGTTGAGKTIFLSNHPNSIDLENLANHRGSSFGRHITDQPTQISFENLLASKLIKLSSQGAKYILMEDEGKHIGRIYLPSHFLHYFQNGKLILLTASLEERINTTFEEYVINSQKEYISYTLTTTQNQSDALNQWSLYILESMKKIKNRLGGDRFLTVTNLFSKALQTQKTSGLLLEHKKWIQFLLEEYYDKMYEYQIANSQKELIFQGDAKQVETFLSRLE